ncbi:MAG: phospholipase D-like domain-containing protein [Candidatus Sericytochromatia bacterium]|nr:phospholipase D-like domain-containing protein [Candidatus Sericytochromatia bacterium]
MSSPSTGLQLHVMPDERDAFFLQSLASAKRSIKLQVYILTHAGVIDALIAAHQRGVEVKVLLEEKPYNPGNPGAPLPTNRAAAKRLTDAGVACRWTNPRFRYTHAKVVTLDETVSFVSTANFTKSGLNAEGKGAREYILEDRSPSDVAAIAALFEADWERRAYTPTDPDLVLSPDNSRTKLFELIRSARREVFLQVEVAGDPELDSVLAAKVKEGVKVRALLADLRRLAPSQDPVYRSNLDVARAWRAAGVEVLFQRKPHLHAKAIQVDGGTFYTGSVNFTSNSMNNNRELGVLVQAPELASALARALEQDFKGAEPLPATSEAPLAPALLAPLWPGLPL